MDKSTPTELKFDCGIPVRIVTNKGVIFKDKGEYFLILFDALGKPFKFTPFVPQNGLLDKIEFKPSTLAFLEVTRFIDLTDEEDFAKMEIFFSFELEDKVNDSFEKLFQENKDFLKGVYEYCIGQFQITN